MHFDIRADFKVNVETMSTRPIRLLDIAAKAGVSRTTVSMALNDHPRISNATKEQVRKIASDLGYQKDPVARALGQKKSGSHQPVYLGTLAMLESERCSRMRKRNPFNDEWNDQLRGICMAMGYRLDYFIVGDRAKEQVALNRVLQSRGIQGLIIFGFCEEIHQWDLEWDRFAAVAFTSSPHEHFIHNVMSSSFQDVYDAIMKLRDKGYKRPGYFTVRKNQDFWDAGFASALDAWEEAGKIPKLKLSDSLNEPVGQEEFLTWFKCYQPDVLVANHSERPLEILAEEGIFAPQDIGYLCLDILPGMEKLSGLVQKRSASFQVLVDLLHSMLMRHELGAPAHPFCVQIPSLWNEGTTLR